MERWLSLFVSPPVVRRGIKVALVVGAILIAINHGDAILAGELSSDRYLKMGLTVLVPYLVSTTSSVGALLQQERSPGKNV